METDGRFLNFPFFNTEGEKSATEAFCSDIELSKIQLGLSSCIVTAVI